MYSSIIIHIGYPKCASTTFQKHLFSNNESLNYLGIFPEGNVGYESETTKRPEYTIAEEKVDRLHSFLIHEEFGENKPMKREKVNSILQEIPNDKKILLSNERFTSQTLTKTSLREKAERLSFFFPNAKIIMCVRDPFGVLISQYRDQPFNPIKNKGGNYVSFDEWIDILLAKRKDILESLRFENTYELYNNLFGEDNVLMVNIESLNQQFQRIGEFLGIPSSEVEKRLNKKRENTGTSEAFTMYRRVIRIVSKIIPDNKIAQSAKLILHKSVKRVLPKKKRNIKYSMETKNKINQYYNTTIIFLNCNKNYNRK